MMMQKAYGVLTDGAEQPEALPESVALADARRLLGLMLEVWELRADAQRWRRHFLQGMCRLVNARVGLTVNTRNHQPSGRTKLDLMVDWGWATVANRRVYMGKVRSGPLADPLASSLVKMDGREPGTSRTVMREEVMADEVWYAHPEVQTVCKGADVNHAICWMYFGPEEGMTISVRLFRPWRESARFTQREVALLDLAGGQLSRLYLAEIAAAGLEPELSTRTQQILALLIRGKGEKDIAELLGISGHTVHDYVKGIYKHYKVGSRSELLAKFIK
jgi:DNA-binding CsgD family transcriptional regulator